MTLDAPTIHWEKAKNLRIELGGGIRPKGEGLINIDRQNVPSVDIVMDFEKDKFPFSDNSVVYIYSSHTLEHVANIYGLLLEMLRISSNGAHWGIITPHPHRSSVMTPEHVHVISKEWWLNQAMNIDYIYPDNWKIIIESFDEPISENMIAKLQKYNIDVNFAIDHMVNIVPDLITNIRVQKE